MDSIIDKLSLFKTAEKLVTPEVTDAISERQEVVTLASRAVFNAMSREHPGVLHEVNKPKNSEVTPTPDKQLSVDTRVEDMPLAERHATGVSDLSVDRARQAVDFALGGLDEAA